MKTKIFIKGLAAFVAVFGMSVVFTSCGDDDDNGKLKNAAKIDGKEVKVNKSTVTIHSNGANLELFCSDGSTIGGGFDQELNGKTIDLVKAQNGKETAFEAPGNDEVDPGWNFWLEQKSGKSFYLNSYGQGNNVKKGTLYLKYEEAGRLKLVVKDLVVETWNQLQELENTTFEMSYDGEAEILEPNPR